MMPQKLAAAGFMRRLGGADRRAASGGTRSHVATIIIHTAP